MSRKIAVYGTGKIAKAYIQDHSESEIVACLDRVFETGEVCGIPIWSFEQVIRAGVDTIVIASATKHVKIIYDRIVHRCLLHHIAIYNTGGCDLISYYGISAMPGWAAVPCCTREQAMSRIESHDIISFDVFDTLIMRTTLEPRDIFDHVQVLLNRKGIACQDFKYYRITAEHMANGNDIYEIYQHFQDITGLSSSVTSQIMQEEIDCEKEHIIPRTTMVFLMNQALAMGKTVNLLSDMYLPEPILRDMLESVGITGYHRLFVSCDYGCTKADGLFDIYKNMYGDKRFLHIGDVEAIDILPAEKAGIDAYQIYSAKDMLCMSDARILYDLADSLNEKTLVGYVIARLFNNPFVWNGGQPKLRIGNYADYGMLLAPLVIQYMVQIENLLDKHTYDGVLFLARDGYLLKKIYDKIHVSGKVKSHYFLSSRKLSIRSGVQNIEELNCSKRYLKGHFDNPVLDLYGVEAEPSQQAGQTWEDMIDANAERIFEHAKRTLTGYKKWIQAAGMDLQKSYLLCELNGYGTSHYYIGKLFEHRPDAVYLVRNHGAGEYTLPCYPVWEFDNASRTVSSLIVNNPLMEVIFTSMQPSVIDMTEDGTPVFANEKRSPEELAAVAKIQEGIEQLAVAYLNSGYVDGVALKKELAEQMLRLAAECVLEGECEKLHDIVFSNDIGNVRQNLFTGEII